MDRIKFADSKMKRGQENSLQVYVYLKDSYFHTAWVIEIHSYLTEAKWKCSIIQTGRSEIDTITVCIRLNLMKLTIFDHFIY